MSGIYIPGMEMPRNGFCIQIVIDDDGKVYSSVEKCILKMGSIARAVPVPPHGRLIDADAVIDLAMQYCSDDDGVCSKAGADLRELLDEIENLPTIIPANEEE